MKAIKLTLAALTIFLLHNASFAQKKVPSATLTVCENTDDNVYPVNPKTTLKVGDKVVFQIAFDQPYKIKNETSPEQFFIAWEVYEMDADGKDAVNISELQMTTNTTYRRYAIEEFQSFPKPGKYRVYALPWEMRDINYKNGNYKNYFGKAEIEVTE